MSDVRHERNPYPGTKEVLPELLKDIQQKAADGKVKYGTHLQTHNGRRALADLYQELIDACFYVKQELMERNGRDDKWTDIIDDSEWNNWVSTNLGSWNTSCWKASPPCAGEVPKVDVGPLMDAHKLVHGDRGNNYGHPYEDFGRTVAAVNAFLGHKFKEPLGPEDIPLIMLCVKLSRESNLSKPDNLTDAAGYIETWWMVKKVQEHVKQTGQMPDLQRLR
jgi:hypothetical protein